MKELTSCYCYFTIAGDFDPAEITKLLNVQPTESWSKGDYRKHGKTQYTFSRWSTGLTKIVFPEWEMKCISVIKDLIGKEEILNNFKQMYDVSFCLEIVPNIYNKEPPIINLDKDVIKFCYLTETDIDIDQYIY